MQSATKASAIVVGRRASAAAHQVDADDHVDLERAAKRTNGTMTLQFSPLRPTWSRAIRSAKAVGPAREGPGPSDLERLNTNIEALVAELRRLSDPVRDQPAPPQRAD